MEVLTQSHPATLLSRDLVTKEFEWIRKLIHYRVDHLSHAESKEEEPEPPEAVKGVNPYFDWLFAARANPVERLALSLCLASSTFPQFLDELHIKDELTAQPFTEFGVYFEPPGTQLRVTWQTVMFLCLGGSNTAQFHLLDHIHADHRLYSQKLLVLPDHRPENPFFTPLKLHHEAFRAWIVPERLRQLADPGFMGHELKTKLDWSDLFLEAETRTGLRHLDLWLEHGNTIMQNEDYRRFISPGIRVLFYGPSGTGKTLATTLLGKKFNMPVYRVDLSQMVSKWIGETEKNLARIFDQAEGQNWILFFDEADALFSKRVNGGTANDRRANQEIAYLLQRVENYDGSVIMASNLRDNIDDAFIRRFQLMIHFPVPGPGLRKTMWQHLLAPHFELEPDLDLEEIAGEYELTGGHLKNIFRTLLLEYFDKPSTSPVISRTDLLEAIELELAKQGIYQVPRRY